nr:NADH dehydrogenase subunit 5 [Xylophagaidae sp. E23]UPX88985.1 NADH dehydrogenase subunit 5 [Xylophagaidae sp. E81]
MQKYTSVFCGAALGLFLCFNLLLFLFGNILSSGGLLIFDFDFSFLSGFLCCIPLVVDWSSLVFSLSVLFISSSIMVFCLFYMPHEEFKARFCYLVVSFVLFMNLLIFIPSIFGMMVGWDGLGVVSFLLVVYYGNSESLGAGIITALSNRIGDALFIILLSISMSEMSWHFFDLNKVYQWYFVGLLVVGSMTKSAQVPFSAWLPAAMAAPTPVSALVHSSTLVTAGVYVLFRFSHVLQGVWLVILGVVSMTTLLLAGISAVFEMDFKKIVAFSTLSQLGVMMLALSLGLKNVCFFHLVTHAFFKALMFLCVGAVIFLGGGIQDVRFFSGLWYKMPVISSWIIVCCLSLVGTPFMAGFYSKDLILEGFIFGDSSFWGILLLYLSVFLTALYSGRLIILMFSSFSFFSAEGFSEGNPYLLISSFGMGLGAIFSGFILQKSIISLNCFVLVPGYFKLLTVFFILLGLFSSVVLSKFNFGGGVYWLVSTMWFLPSISGGLLSKVSLSSFVELGMILEKGWLNNYLMGTLKFVLLKQGKFWMALIQTKYFMGGLLIVIFFLASAALS